MNKVTGGNYSYCQEVRQNWVQDREELAGVAEWYMDLQKVDEVNAFLTQLSRNYSPIVCGTSEIPLALMLRSCLNSTPSYSCSATAPYSTHTNKGIRCDLTREVPCEETHDMNHASTLFVKSVCLRDHNYVCEPPWCRRDIGTLRAFLFWRLWVYLQLINAFAAGQFPFLMRPITAIALVSQRAVCLIPYAHSIPSTWSAPLWGAEHSPFGSCV